MDNRFKILSEQIAESIPKYELSASEWIEIYNNRFANAIVRMCAERIMETTRNHKEYFADKVLELVNG